MKKILLATSALVAMTGVAVAGDAPAAVAPMAPTADGFTVTATGEVTVFGFTNSNARALVPVVGVAGAIGYVAPIAQVFANGFGAKVDATLKAEKTLDDGATVSVNVEYNGAGSTEAFIKYSSSIGDFQAGAIKNNTKHGVSNVSAPALGDWLDDSDFIKQTAFVGLTTPGVAFAGVSYENHVTYASPEFGGFKLGLGLGNKDFGIEGVANPLTAFDAVLAGSFAAGEATVKVSVGANGRTTNFGAANTTAAHPATLTALNSFIDYEVGDEVTAGASIEIAGFTIGGNYKNVLNGVAAKAVASYDVGVKYTANEITGSVKYSVADLTNFSNRGVVSGGLQYNGGALLAEVRGSYNNYILGTGVNGYTVQAAVAYKMDAITAVASVSSANTGGTLPINNVTTNVATLGVDYALNSNVTVGAGVSYTDSLTNYISTANNTAATAGLKVKF